MRKISQNGAVRSQALMFAQSVGLTCHAIGEPTDQLVKVRGIMTTKKLKAGSVVRKRVHTRAKLAHSATLCEPKSRPSNSLHSLQLFCRQNNRQNPQNRWTVFAGAAAAVCSVACPEIHAAAGALRPLILLLPVTLMPFALQRADLNMIYTCAPLV